MRNIEVAVLNESHMSPGGMMLFLAKLTQRGHKIHNMKELKGLYASSVYALQDEHIKTSTIAHMANLPHGTIKRFTPITVAIVGASRRFLAQARTHQVGFNYVSASLQYSDYSGQADFVVPYELYGDDKIRDRTNYLSSCKDSMEHYQDLVQHGISNDTAGYAAPQGLRNILIMQANHEAWMYFISLRGCNRNTTETQYVTMRIWEELLKTADGEEMFQYAGPECTFGMCKEGKMCCGNSLKNFVDTAHTMNVSVPRLIIDSKWPLLKEEE